MGARQLLWWLAAGGRTADLDGLFRVNPAAEAGAD